MLRVFGFSLLVRRDRVFVIVMLFIVGSRVLAESIRL